MFAAAARKCLDNWKTEKGRAKVRPFLLYGRVLAQRAGKFSTRKARRIIVLIVSFIIIAVLVGIDQLTKYFTVVYVKPVGSISVIDGFFRLTYVENRGAALGMFQNQRWFFIGMTSLLILAACVLLVKYKHHTWASYTCAILIIGGGIGNLIDRVLVGFVVDFLSFSIFPPVFNFADCCVTVGAFLFAYHVLFAERKLKSMDENGNKEANEDLKKEEILEDTETEQKPAEKEGGER
jgi:signal peptidase II